MMDEWMVDDSGKVGLPSRSSQRDWHLADDSPAYAYASTRQPRPGFAASEGWWSRGGSNP